MKIKPGVVLLDLKPQILLAIIIADRIFEQYQNELVITSVNDGKHMNNSLHFNGFAVDFRSRTFTEPQLINVIQELKVSLGENYDVVKEIDHIHVEYDPKKGMALVT